MPIQRPPRSNNIHPGTTRKCQHWARDKKTNALGPYVCDWHSIVVVSKGPFRVGSGEVGIGGGVGISVCRPVLCRAVPCRHGGGGGQRGLVPRNAYCTMSI